MLEGFVRTAWRGQGGVSGGVFRAASLPLEGLFRMGVWWRNRRFDRSAGAVLTPEIPVLSVGNLSVGGTGKTPVAAWIVARLSALGARPALVARGYGEDELLLHRRWNPQAPVVADQDRHRGVATAAREGATLAVLDDGFQHRRVGRDLDVVLVAAEEGLPGALLPRGPFREGMSALGRAHSVVVTRKSATTEEAGRLADQVTRARPSMVVAVAALEPGPLRSLTGDEVAPPSGEVLVASGVARPESVAASATAFGLRVSETLGFPDHHDFTDADVRRIASRARRGGEVLTVVVTEKDAVKLERLSLPGELQILVLGLRLRWESGEDAFNQQLQEFVERSR